MSTTTYIQQNMFTPAARALRIGAAFACEGLESVGVLANIIRNSQAAKGIAAKCDAVKGIAANSDAANSISAISAVANSQAAKCLAAKGHELYKSHGKRALDVAISAGSLAVFAIPMAAIAVAIKVEDPTGPVIFKQERLGKDGRTFQMYKFRSMCVGAEQQGSGVYSGAGDNRVTRVGTILRKTSADELPQLINMLKGDMSLVGPRPPMTYHPWKLEDYTPEQRRMFDVRPGLTGWAQINGRRTVEWNQRIDYNVWYVDNYGFRLDVEIFLKTFAKIASGENNENLGATAGNVNPTATTEVFAQATQSVGGTVC